MKLGAILPQAEIDSPSMAKLRAYVAVVQELGFDHLMAYDHVVGADVTVRPGWTGAYDSTTPFLEPFTLFAHLAGICALEFVTDVMILPQRQTALVAKQAATLDLLAEGRLRFGVGIGWNAVEYDTLGVDFTTRGRRFEEQLGLLRRYWTEASVQFSGEFERADHVGISPLPVQRPIPLWIGCSDAPRALDRVGRLADGFVPHPELRWDGQLEESIDRVRAIAGRRSEPAVLGLQGTVRWYEDGPAGLGAALERWRGVGATHVAVNTLRSGLDWPDGHIAVLRDVATQWALAPQPATEAGCPES